MQQDKSTNISSPTPYQGIDGVVYSTSQDNDIVEQVVISKTEITSGPLPHPDLIEKYNNVIDNGAERIMRMAELQQENRFAERKEIRETNREIALSKLDYFKRGQIMGFILAIALLGLATLFVFTGHEKIAYVVMSVGAVSLVGLFIQSLTEKSKEKT